MKRTAKGATLTFHEIDTMGQALYAALQVIDTQPEKTAEGINCVLNCLAALMPGGEA